MLDKYYTWQNLTFKIQKLLIDIKQFFMNSKINKKMKKG